VVYYGYDAADRLTGETWKESGGSTIYAFAWDYDPVGNRTYQSQNSVQTYYDYNEGNELTQYHELPADAWTYFAYDSRGNCLRIQEPSGTTYFEYSDADLVTSIQYPGGTTNTFRYDGQGNWRPFGVYARHLLGFESAGARLPCSRCRARAVETVRTTGRTGWLIGVERRRV